MQQYHRQLGLLLDLLNLDEEPMGLFYTDEKPAEGYSPKQADLPTLEKEEKMKSTGRLYSAHFPAQSDTSGGLVKRKPVPTFRLNNSDALVEHFGSVLTNHRHKP